MAKTRAEHNTVLGANPEEDNQLTYTLARNNETFRFFHVVSSPCKGVQDFILTHSEGWLFPTDHCLVWVLQHGVHHNPALWPRTA